MVRSESRALSDEAIRSGGQVDENRLKSLERLTRLTELRAAAESPGPGVRWPAVALLVGTLVIVSALFFARVPETEVELELSVSELSFRLPRAQVLMDALPLSDLGVIGLQEILLPADPSHEPRPYLGRDGTGSSIRLSSRQVSAREGRITLAAINLPAGARISFRPTDFPREHRLTIGDAPLQLRADVYGPATVWLPGRPRETLDFAVPRPIHLQSDSGLVDLVLGFPRDSVGQFVRQLQVDNLSLGRTDWYSTAERNVERRTSTVLTGTVYFQSLEGQELLLRPSEDLRFGKSQGEIRTLVVDGDKIRLTFHGRVQGMTTGTDEHRVSLMPTYLEWLRAGHGLSLLWGSALYIFGIVFSAIRWWKAPR
jgi:hypothetical protein